MVLEFKEYHNCESIRPVMFTSEIRSEVEGRWPFKRTVQRTVKVWNDRAARWTCPVCDSLWVWHPALGKGLSGYWSAKTRNFSWVTS